VVSFDERGYTNPYDNVRNASLAKSKDHWKNRVRELEADMAKLKAQVRASAKEIEDLKKTLRSPI
jgi:predicted  nucleic acid-binding Zn-ribbon protein